MRITVYGTKAYDERVLRAAAEDGPHEIVFLEPKLDAVTAPLAKGSAAACIFVNDEADEAALEALAEAGVELLLLRCAGFNNVDLAAAARLDLQIGRVPAYSPHAVAEHAVTLMLTLNRKTHRAYARVREGNFALEGLEGWDVYGKTVGVVGTGEIGACAVRLFHGFGAHVLAVDPQPDDSLEEMARYTDLDTLLRQSDVISLHCPLTPETYHMIDERALSLTKDSMTLINTGRGGLVDTRAVIAALKAERIGALGLDVYEEEGDIFFEDLSGHAIRDDVFARLLTFPNVLVTGHQGFFTHEALAAIAATTLANADAYEETGTPLHAVTPPAS